MIPSSLEKREAIVLYGHKFIGQPYEWGGDGKKAKGFDCSGLVLELLWSVGLCKGIKDATAQNIYDMFKERKGVWAHQHGNLIFFGKDDKHITHIGLTVNAFQYLEAGGGDSKNLGGMVRLRPQWYRSDVVEIIDIFKE